jgi:hypothetical protein
MRACCVNVRSAGAGAAAWSSEHRAARDTPCVGPRRSLGRRSGGARAADAQGIGRRGRGGGGTSSQVDPVAPTLRTCICRRLDAFACRAWTARLRRVSDDAQDEAAAAARSSASAATTACGELGDRRPPIVHARHARLLGLLGRTQHLTWLPSACEERVSCDKAKTSCLESVN